VLNAVSPYLLALAGAILFLVLAVRRRGGPFLAGARSILIQPRVFFAAAGMAIMYALALLLTHRAVGGLHRGDWMLIAALAALGVGFAVAGIVIRTHRASLAHLFSGRARSPGLRGDPTRSAARVFWGGFYAGPLALFVYMALAFPTDRPLADESPALFVPFIPIGLPILLSGVLLWIDYRGLREVFRQSFYGRMFDLIPRSYDAAGLQAGCLLLVGGAVFTVGVVTAIVALAEAF